MLKVGGFPWGCTCRMCPRVLIHLSFALVAPMALPRDDAGAAPVSHRLSCSSQCSTSGEGVSAGSSPTLGALPGDCSDSCQQRHQCHFQSPWRSVAFHLPIYLGWCSCVNERMTPARSQQSALRSAFHALQFAGRTL